MIRRICTNYSKCVLADNHEDFSQDKNVMSCCPICDMELSEVENPLLSEVRISSPKEARIPSQREVRRPSSRKDARTASPQKQRKANSIFSDLALATVLILLLGLVAEKDWIRSLQGANAAEVKPPANAILRLAGSDVIGDNLGPALAKAFLETKGATNLQVLPGVNPQEKIIEGLLPGEAAPSSIEIAAHGSATAFAALAEESCDIGISSRRIKPEEVTKLASLGNMTSAGSEHILGVDGLAVIVNPANRLNELRKDEIRRIFTGDITDWSQVGSFHGAIKVYAGDDQSGAFDNFKGLVLNGKALAPSARRFEDSNALSEAVSGDPNGIGIVSLPYIHNAKSIAVSEKGTDALKPTRLTVATEDYLLSRRLYLYTPATARNKFTQMFVEFALSQQGQDVVAATGFAAQNLQPVPQAVSKTAPDEYQLLTENAERLPLSIRSQGADLTQDSKALSDLDRVAALIADRGSAGNRILLFGFADNSGTTEENQAASLNRARVVENQLIQRGIKPAAVRGFGADMPVASEDTEEGRGLNRRVEIWIKKK